MTDSVWLQDLTWEEVRALAGSSCFDRAIYIVNSDKGDGQSWSMTARSFFEQ